MAWCSAFFSADSSESDIPKDMDNVFEYVLPSQENTHALVSGIVGRAFWQKAETCEMRYSVKTEITKPIRLPIILDSSDLESEVSTLFLTSDYKKDLRSLQKVAAFVRRKSH